MHSIISDKSIPWTGHRDWMPLSLLKSVRHKDPDPSPW